jgi:hypothetical protein
LSSAAWATNPTPDYHSLRNAEGGDRLRPAPPFCVGYLDGLSAKALKHLLRRALSASAESRASPIPALRRGLTLTLNLRIQNGETLFDIVNTLNPTPGVLLRGQLTLDRSRTLDPGAGLAPRGVPIGRLQFNFDGQCAIIET